MFGRRFFEMIEDECRQHQLLLLQPQAKLLAKGVPDAYSTGRLSCWVLGLFCRRLGGCRVYSKFVSGREIDREVASAFQPSLVRHASLDLYPRDGLQQIGELIHGDVLAVELAVILRIHTLHIFFARWRPKLP